MGEAPMTLDEWIQIGIKNNWVEQFCYSHDTPPLTDDESEKYYQYNDDFCVPALRVWL